MRRYVKYGKENLICVRADATLEEGWFYEGAGIYRDVWLEKMAEVSVAPFGTFVYAELQQPYDHAVVHVKTEVTNSGLKTQLYEVEQRMLDAEGCIPYSPRKHEQATIGLRYPIRISGVLRIPICIKWRQR